MNQPTLTRRALMLALAAFAAGAAVPAHAQDDYPARPITLVVDPSPWWWATRPAAAPT